MQLEIKKIGNSAGIILPKDVLSKLRLQPGDSIVLTEAADGFHITKSNPLFERTIAAARAAMKTYKDDFAALAK